MATTQPEIWSVVINFKGAGGPSIGLRGWMKITDPIDGTERISKDGMERVEVVGDAWPALNTFLAKVLEKANDGRYGRDDIVFVTPPELPEETP